ncbi:hypothetical protein HPB48_017187 [Haemaphysalis longicornis]|uniref:Uncharacterized protein n=1 Tax=Haemaphysalis longicornis TaxID=44386 RepID=A0A9J6FT20_HAELO|nr:hypothetical protein HPB48_017187 [Haemaphysalis longicornis]
MAGEGPGAACREDAELAALVSEFFSDGTSNQRKQQIERHLAELRQQPDSWCRWVRLLDQPQASPGLLVFALTALQEAGPTLDQAARQAVWCALERLLLSPPGPQPPFVRNKLCQLLVGLACMGGPQEQAGFLDCILQTTSEEVGGVPREDRRSGPKREELRRLVEQRTPQVVALLTGVLGIEACRGSVKQALCCVEHLLSWLPLAEVGHELVGALCRWATSALGSGTPQLLLRLAITALQTTPTAKDDSSYLDKLTEFVRLFVNVYLSRPGNGSAELPQLLRLLFDRTFQETSLERYQVCLEAWGIVLSWMLVTQTGEAYGELVQALVPQLLVRCFQRRGHQLCDRQLSLVSKAAEVRPKDVCSLVLEPELGMYKMGTATAGRLGYLCVLLQALQRLSSLLEPHLVKEVITRLCQVALSGKELLSCADKALAAEAVDVQVQLMAAVRSLCGYLRGSPPPTELLVELALPFILQPCEQFVAQSVHGALCLPWSGVASAAQSWDQRAALQARLVESLGRPLLRPQPGDTVEVVARSLKLLCALVAVLEGGKVSEEPVLCLVGVLLRVLGAQLGADRVRPLLGALEQRLPPPPGVSNNNNQAAAEGLEWMLGLLLPLVQEPSLGAHFLPAILTLCLDQVQPRLAQCPVLVAVLGPPLFLLLEQSLVCHWRHFFPAGDVLAAARGVQPLAGGTTPPEFGRLMAAYGWSLRLPEPALVRQNLLALSGLNSRCRLFHKVLVSFCHRMRHLPGSRQKFVPPYAHTEYAYGFI